MPTNTKYTAFLLGINIGPHKRVPMAELKKLCENLGFTDVKTFLASGNVVFNAERTTSNELVALLETELEKTFGFFVGVIVRPMSDIYTMLETDPFKSIEVTKNTRLYVTFFTDTVPPIETPQKMQDKKGGDFTLLDIKDQVAYSVLELGESGTTDAMEIIGRLFGKKMTTRNWNTIQKIAK